MSEGCIPIAMIQESEVALRPVNRQSEKYLQLVESIKSKGVINAISVREIRHPETRALIGYGLCDGLHRFTGAKDAGLEEIPAHITNFNDAELLEAQLIANMHKIDTRPVEYTRQLIRILGANPLLTTHELAHRLAVSDTFVSQRLNLIKLAEPIQELVEKGQINLTNAFALAKLPESEQADFVDRAMTDGPQVFVPAVSARVKELRDANRQGREAEAAVFEPHPHLQTLKDIKTEFENHEVEQTVIKESGASSAVDGFRAAVAWVLHMDASSCRVQVAKNEQRLADREAAKAKRDEERSRRKEQQAAAAAADISKL